MNWQDLAYFVTLVQQQTLTACASELDVQHSTVSRRIERLEQSLGIKLFNRLGKRYVLTQEGETLFNQAMNVQQEIDVFKRMAIDQNTLQGEVTVSAPPVLANEVLMPALMALRQQYPDIQLKLCGEVEFSDLHRREADIALRLSRPIEEDLVIRTLGEVRYGYFAHHSYVTRIPAPHWQLINFQANRRLTDWLELLIEQHGYSIAFTTNDLYMVTRAVNDGVGIGILPYFLANNHPELVLIDPLHRRVITDSESLTIATEDPSLISKTPLTQSYPLYLVVHPDVRRSARVRAVADWLITTTSQLNV